MISLTQSAARYVSKLSNKLRRKLDMLSSRKEFSGSQGRTLHFLLAQAEDIFQKDIDEEYLDVFFKVIKKMMDNLSE